jgi:hypothetical protein
MAFWEFLIQKEGDRSWLPLESPKVEILEGRYRMVARSSRINAPVEIRMVQNAAHETPPIRRIQKRTSQTNKDGLIVIIPFTRLLPGEWQLRCTADLMAEMSGDGWQHTVQLQVLPLESASEDWDTDWQEEAIAAAPAPEETTEQSEMAAASPEHNPTEPIAVQEAADLSADVLNGFTPSEAIDRLNAEPLTALAHSLQLSLEHQTYVVLREQPLRVTGQVQPKAEQPDLAFAGGHLRLRLFDPQTSQMQVDETQTLAEQPLPLPFSLTVALPPNCETHLLLGELALYGAPDAGSLPTVLATQSFSVTTDLLELLETLANGFPADLPPEPTPSKSPISSSFITLPPKMAPVQFRAVTQSTLPPLLRPSESAKERRSLDLPTFSPAEAAVGLSDAAEISDELAANGVVEAPELTESLGVHPQFVDIPELTDISDIGEAVQSPEQLASRVADSSESGVAPEPEGAEAEHRVERSPTLPKIFVDPAVDWENVEPLVPWRRSESASEPEPTPTPEDHAFRALNLQERFLERLQALACDTELAEWLHALEPPAATETDTDAPESSESAESPEPMELVGIFAKRSQLKAIGRDADLAAQEIVVDDEPSGSPAATLTAAYMTALVEPLPTPHLEVPAGELIAGQTLTITIKLPATDARVYAKLWTHDRQSRTLLDGPHWLMDFSPDGLGNLVSKTPIMVPFGCVEVQLEAIAIEMTSQRESDKVSVIRAVIPPSLSSVFMDDLTETI